MPDRRTRPEASTEAPRASTTAAQGTETGRNTALRGAWTAFAGLAVGAACATSDMVLERERGLERAATCYEGVREHCYSGPGDVAGRGACRYGERTCEQGQWSECVGEVLPSAETCNRRDDDCDGIVDNGFEREGALCFREGAAGICRTRGRWRCSPGGTRSVCDAPVVEPEPERCDGLDNDCDGVVDEDSIRGDAAECSTGRAGLCAAGTLRCIQGRTQCVQNVQPGVEICNGLDDNCNNTVDEDCVEADN